ncbi:4-hydroxythreonine-4-phosphate dehydrogenase, partial [Mesorhizobium sp. M7A.F.Ca.CA.002.15.1.1]
MGNAVTALALSAGDPSGIGPEIAIAAFMAREAAALPPFYLLADPALIASRARLLGLSLPIAEATP